MIIRDALFQGTELLRNARIADPATDARWLLAHVLGCEAGTLVLRSEQELQREELSQFQLYLEQRRGHQPVAQILGSRMFWGRQFRVTTDTLDPRPETEILIAAAVESSLRPTRILDLGTGTGCILLSLLGEFPEAQGLGTDLSIKALSVATHNAQNLSMSDRAEFLQSDWWSNVEGEFDLIVSNPPYITAEEMRLLDRDVVDWEPHVALTPGGDGLGAYRNIARRLDKFLTTGGIALFEFGRDQERTVREIFEDAGWGNLQTLQDLNGHQRALMVAS